MILSRNLFGTQLYQLSQSSDDDTEASEGNCGRSVAMVSRTVLKVDISCLKCKKKLLKAISGLEGIDKIELDPAKNTLTVTGSADPVQIIVRTRKTGKTAEVVSIGPPPPPPKKDGGGGGGVGGGQKKGEEKKGGEEKKSEQKAQMVQALPQTCHVCEERGMHVGPYEPGAQCSIL